MFLDGTLRYTDDFCESFSSYIRIVFYKLKNNIYRFISIFLTTFLTTPFSNAIRTNINTFYFINIKLWQSKNETVPWGRETALIYKKTETAIRDFCFWKYYYWLNALLNFAVITCIPLGKGS